MARISVDGVAYPVAESLGYYVKTVAKPDGEEWMAVAHRKSGPWRWWTARDRLSGGGTRAVGQATPGGERP